MTSTDVQVALRPPVVVRLLVVGFAVLFLGAATGGTGFDGPLDIPGPLFTALLGGALAWRLCRLAAIGTADGRLVVRNHWRDRTVRREDVVDVRVERKHRLDREWAVHLLLADGSRVALDVTEVPFRSGFARRLERHADAVRTWVAGRPQPYL